jgi:hypothetical protein
LRDHLHSDALVSDRSDECCWREAGMSASIHMRPLPLERL